MQFEAQTTLAHDAVKSGLNLLKFSDVRYASHCMKRRHLAGHLDFAAFFDPSHAKRQLLLMASLDQV
jgi:hypothetical protein